MQVSMKNISVLAVLAVGGALLIMSAPAEETPREITEQEAALHKAASEHDYDRAIQLARSAKELEFLGPGETTVLCEAAHDRSADAYDLVLELLKLGAEPNRRCGSEQAKTPLYLAALVGNLAVVDLLIRYGAEINPKVEPVHYGPIYGAYMTNAKRVIEHLEQNGASMPKEHRDNLRRMQAMTDILAQQPIKAPEGIVDAEEWKEQKIHAAIRETHADLPDVMAMLDAIAEYRRNNPRPEGMSTEEWKNRQLKAAEEQVYGPLGAFNQNSTGR